MTVALTPSIHIASDPFESPGRETVRFAMHRRLSCVFPEPPLPEGYTVVPFTPSLIPAFSAVTRMSFMKSPDRDLYPELRSRKGCNYLIRELTEMQGFLPEVSFLVRWHNEPVAVLMTRRMPGCVFGEIQLAAVSPRHRRKGIASYLATRAMWAFRDLQIPHASLHVNSINRAGIRFFRHLGFIVNASGLYG